MEQPSSKNTIEVIKLGADSASSSEPQVAAAPVPPQQVQPVQQIDLPVANNNNGSVSGESLEEDEEETEYASSVSDDTSVSEDFSTTSSTESLMSGGDDEVEDESEEDLDGSESTTEDLLESIEDVMTKFFTNTQGQNIAQVLTNINEHLASIVKALQK